MEHFKRSTARDFRINGATLEAVLNEESSDEGEVDNDEQDEVSSEVYSTHLLHNSYSRLNSK